MGKNILISNSNKNINQTIELTGSKSESNRALIIQALSKGKVQIENLSSAADTVTLDNILKNAAAGNIAEANVGPAGTAMRFLASYLTVKGINTVLTGTERMKQRPIGILVDALRHIGGEIVYIENEGFPPLQIPSQFIQKSEAVKIKGDISSQYITSLLLIASFLPKGLTLEIEGELTSRPYVEMTLGFLEQCGIKYTWNDNKIAIPHQEFNESKLIVEPDWSAASYWYAFAALADSATITLPYLRQNSLQGDSAIVEIMSHFGVKTTFNETGLILEKVSTPLDSKFFDLKNCPDLAQTVIVVSAALGHEATFTGLETLKIKETDRIKALQEQLAKIGVKLIEKDLNYTLDCSGLHFPEKIFINTYEDHRMAMAFAPLALFVKEVEIEEERVVDKSYPHYWEDVRKIGFTLS
ncbi:3-phosphoshikimate 1-carboxyvinyltransferase [Pseudopedobacter saltans DSM 12145]|uniref:3-phosphoshikimate 1-carboxyvinyltransferase n=1 Tax=Pseudopedobacter saltans (strain ATCC 51119 / DSM 12145 / JCM 21818 / CCUG 39354 / LMG 10337 / NBRC 100064 / NCIMB 13643) TaxID=762903 RepID=F0S804_PSESL|nr:3-phosphoshikimate 1-carboxyvinyltransferase [Pseudopedobacter saltans]ADY51225.1 3-phosphoshikimate 1-carboxyvinyltransferase [Pseudopedobacter saltans DSM 12145]